MLFRHVTRKKKMEFVDDRVEFLFLGRVENIHVSFLMSKF